MTVTPNAQLLPKPLPQTPVSRIQLSTQHLEINIYPSLISRFYFPNFLLGFLILVDGNCILPVAQDKTMVKPLTSPPLPPSPIPPSQLLGNLAGFTFQTHLEPSHFHQLLHDQADSSHHRLSAQSLQQSPNCPPCSHPCLLEAVDSTAASDSF